MEFFWEYLTLGNHIFFFYERMEIKRECDTESEVWKKKANKNV